MNNRILIESIVDLRAPTRIVNEGIISRDVDIYQINPKTNEVTTILTEKCTKDGVDLWSQTYTAETITVPTEILKPICDLFAEQFIYKTEIEAHFGCKSGDFKRIENENNG